MGAVSAKIDAAVSKTKTKNNEEQSRIVSSELFSASAKSQSSRTAGGNPEEIANRGTSSAFRLNGLETSGIYRRTALPLAGICAGIHTSVPNAQLVIRQITSALFGKQSGENADARMCGGTVRRLGERQCKLKDCECGR